MSKMPSTNPTPPPPPSSVPPATSPRSASSSHAERPRLAMATPRFDPPRLCLMAVEGYGKSTIGAFAPKPAILMSQGETGYLTLLSGGRVPAAPAVELPTWEDLLSVLDDIAAGDDVQTLVLDAIDGFERMCQQHVCDRDFSGNWGDKGFANYQRGYEITMGEWLKLLVRLDEIRTRKNIAVLLLSHCKGKPFKNPLGPDYDRYVANMHEKTWDVTRKWTDAVFFGNFVSVIEKEKGQSRLKGKGGDSRVLYTARTDGYDAKNRYGMEHVLDIPDDYTKGWSTLWAALTANQSMPTTQE
jgi:hypothetical protein